MNHSLKNRMWSGQNGAKLRKMLDDMRKTEFECGMAAFVKKVRKPTWREKVTAEFHKTYLYRIMSAGYRREVEKK